MLGAETDDIDTVQEREDVRGKDLPDEHPRERGPEQLESLVICRAVEMKGLRKMRGDLLDGNDMEELTLEDGHSRKVLWIIVSINMAYLLRISYTPVDHLTRVDGEGSQKTNKTVTGRHQHM